MDGITGYSPGIGEVGGPKTLEIQAQGKVKNVLPYIHVYLEGV